MNTRLGLLGLFLLFTSGFCISLCSETLYVSTVSPLTLPLPSDLGLEVISASKSHETSLVISENTSEWAIYITTHHEPGKGTTTYYISSRHLLLTELVGLHSWGAYYGITDVHSTHNGVVISTFDGLFTHNPWAQAPQAQVAVVGGSLRGRWLVVPSAAWIATADENKYVSLAVRKPEKAWPLGRDRLQPVIVDLMPEEANSRRIVRRFKNSWPESDGVTIQALGVSGTSIYAFYGLFDPSLHAPMARHAPYSIGAIFKVSADKFERDVHADEFELVWSTRVTPENPMWMLGVSPVGEPGFALTPEPAVAGNVDGEISSQDVRLRIWTQNFDHTSGESCLLVPKLDSDTAFAFSTDGSQVTTVTLDIKNRQITGSVMIFSSIARTSPAPASQNAVFQVAGGLGGAVAVALGMALI